MEARQDVIAAARAVMAERYGDARIAFAAGSIVRGEGTAYSDLDLVVVYAHLPCAYRESFKHRHLPVEAFVHDLETLNYFFLNMDRPSGMPSLPQMVHEGVEIPGPNDASRLLKERAAALLALGPPELSSTDLNTRRYNLTSLVDDLRAPRSRDEATATGAQLFEALADYHLRANGLWSGKGKAIPRALIRANAVLGARYSRSFEELFATGDARGVIALAEDLLAPGGGLLFEGHRLDAPAEWR